MLNASTEYRNSIYAPIRQIDAKMRFTYQGETKEFLDDKIISMNILEDVTTINNTVPSNEVKITMDNTDGDFNALNYAKMWEIISSKPTIEVFLGLVISENPKTIEWVPMGIYNLISWKNEVGNMTITMYGRDNFDMLSDISYNNTQNNTLYNLAVDILTQAQITKYIIDDSLKTISGSFKDRLDMRSALQHIGIASRSAVFQDRLGNVVIKPLSTLDQSSNYLTYSGQSQMISGTTWAIPLVTTGSGMRYIDFDQQYQEPDVQLDKSIYEIIIRLYSGQGNPQERRYVNTALKGNNGASFLIDNPLIETSGVADAVAEWMFRETNYNAIYKVNWRQNPILETTDIVLVEDQFNANKQTRVYRNDFEYDGTLRGILESRGGI